MTPRGGRAASHRPTRRARLLGSIAGFVALGVSCTTPTAGDTSGTFRATTSPAVIGTSRSCRMFGSEHAYHAVVDGSTAPPIAGDTAATQRLGDLLRGGGPSVAPTLWTNRVKSVGPLDVPVVFGLPVSMTGADAGRGGEPSATQTFVVRPTVNLDGTAWNLYADPYTTNRSAGRSGFGTAANVTYAAVNGSRLGTSRVIGFPGSQPAVSGDQSNFFSWVWANLIDVPVPVAAVAAPVVTTRGLNREFSPDDAYIDYDPAGDNVEYDHHFTTVHVDDADPEQGCASWEFIGTFRPGSPVGLNNLDPTSSPPNNGSLFTAATGARWDLRSTGAIPVDVAPGTSGAVPAAYASANASGTPYAPGVIRVDDVVDAGGAVRDLDHVALLKLPMDLIRAATATDTGAQWPAIYSDGSSTSGSAPRMGTWFRLRPGAAAEVAAKAAGDGGVALAVVHGLQAHGAFLSDSGPARNGSSGAWSLAGEPSTRWSDATMTALGALRLEDFELLDAGTIAGMHAGGRTAPGTVPSATAAARWFLIR